MGKFRWVSWTVIVLLLASGLYNGALVWEAPSGTYWRLLTIKVILALVVLRIACPDAAVHLSGVVWRPAQIVADSGVLPALFIILVSAYLRRA
jgi:hypothetical protein